MNRHPLEFRCDVCRRLVDEDTRARARRAWSPLIICEGCLRDAEEPFARANRSLAFVTAVR